MKRCTNCTLPDTIPGITFDAEGVCSYCSSSKDFKEAGEEKLIQLVDTIRQKHPKYDAIVPISGGRDSSFVLWYAVKVLKLRVLAVSFHNDFVNNQAIDNIKNASGILNNDYLIVRSKFSLPRLVTKHYLKANAKAGPYGVINTMCAACTFGQKAAVLREADKQNIPLILWGGSSSESTLDILETASEKYRRDYKKFFKNPVNKRLNIHLYLAKFFYFLLKLEFFVRGNSVFKKKFSLKRDDILQISLFDYVKWDRKRIKETIMNELGWKKAEGHVSTWRNDCNIHPFMNWAFVKMYGCTKDSFGYSNMINNGNMNREESLYQEEKMLEDIESNAKRIASEIIGLSEEEFNKIAEKK
ncbi:MAG: hypothetical protein PHW02_02070 [bacterium]|nr:hypothetical protein [bacterium]